MEIKQEIITMLHMLPQPAFLARDGVVCHANAAAGAYLIRQDQPLEELLAGGMEDYTAFAEGSVYLALQLGGQKIGTVVTALDGCHLLTLEQPTERAQLQGMALAAQQIRGPLSAMIAASSEFMSDASAGHPDSAGQFNCRMHQLLRRLGNMTDALHYADPENGWMEYTEMAVFLEEILEKSAEFAKQSGYTVRYELPREPVCTMADREKIERALLNMLSNAMKFAPEDSEILVQLTCRGKRLCLSVTGSGERLSGDIYSRFCRQPMLEDPRNGIGLGMVLIRATALAHGGAVFTDQPEEGRSRVTLSLPIRRPEKTGFRMLITHMDYAGGYDHCLLELSDVLSPELYQNQT